MSLAARARDLREGRTTSRALTEAALEAVAADPRAFTQVRAEAALAEAEAADRGERPGPLSGLPVSIKDLFDLEGFRSEAGTPVLADAPPAAHDGPVAARLKQAGAVIVGKTQMSAFAFTAIGLNAYGAQPPNPYDPARAPGGSSSGAAVSVALGQALGAIGSDTGGSIRIPAALCGLVGFKPTQRRVTREGAVGLAESLDSVGPIAADVESCRMLDAVLADSPPEPHPPVRVRGLRFGVIQQLGLEGLDPQVAADFGRALERLKALGATVEPLSIPELDRMAELEARGGVINAEAYALHRRMGWLERRDLYDPNVLARIEIGRRMSAADYLDVRAGWAAADRAITERGAAFDALLWPTCAIVAPVTAELTTPEAFARANLGLARNTRVANLMDRCAISLPMSPREGLQTGLMLIGERMADARLLAVAQAIEGGVRP